MADTQVRKDKKMHVTAIHYNENLVKLTSLSIGIVITYRNNECLLGERRAICSKRTVNIGKKLSPSANYEKKYRTRKLVAKSRLTRDSWSLQGRRGDFRLAVRS